MNKDELKFSFNDNAFKFESEDIVEDFYEKDDNSLNLFYNMVSFGDIFKEQNDVILTGISHILIYLL
jgi:hypothetical protein